MADTDVAVQSDVPAHEPASAGRDPAAEDRIECSALSAPFSAGLVSVSPAAGLPPVGERVMSECASGVSGVSGSPVVSPLSPIYFVLYAFRSRRGAL